MSTQSIPVSVGGAKRRWEKVTGWINQPTSGRILATLLAAAMMPATHGSAIAATAPAAGALSARPAHRRLGYSNRARVIVTFRGDLTQRDRARLTGLDCDVYRSLPTIHCAAVAVPRHNLAKLAELPFVQQVDRDVVIDKTEMFVLDSRSMALCRY